MDYWVIPGIEEHQVDDPTLEELLNLHESAPEQGFTVDLNVHVRSNTAEVIFNEIVVDAGSSSR